MKFKDSIFRITHATFIIMLVVFTSCNGQSDTQKGADVSGADKTGAAKEGVQWLSFEEAVKKSEQVPKKIFIDVYTDWCGWCKKMDATTFKETEVADYLNENFYPVKLNAETKETIRFRDKEFKFVAEYKSNELAVSLLNGKMGYPSYVLLDEKFTMMTPPVQSYMTKENLMPILTFFGDEIFKTKTWEEFEKEKK